MALRLNELGQRMTLVYTPTGDELPDVAKHIVAMESRLDMVVTRVGFVGGLRALIREQHMLPNWRARFCTRMLKIAPFQAWLNDHRPAVVYVGLRADEEGRAGVEYTWPDVTVRYPLREWAWGVSDVLEYLKAKAIVVPPRTDCARCFFQTLYEWYLLWHNHCESYLDAEEDESLIGHTYRSPQRDSHPASLRELRAEFEDGYVPTPRRREGGCRYCTL